MRILILSWRDLEHPLAGGSEVYSQHLARHWAGKGHQVTYFCASVPGLPAEQVLDGYRLVRRGNRLTVYREARRWYRTEGRGRFDQVLDVVNTRPFLTPRYVTDAPVTALVHQICAEVWRYEAPWPLALAGRYWLEPRWLATYRSTPVLTVSQSSRRSLEAFGLREVTVVPEGADVPRLDLPKESVPTVIFVGRLSANKRPDHALEAFRLLQGHLPACRLWVVGSGPMQAKLERHAPAGVTFFGRVDQATKHALMARANLLVATSVREGWGLTVSEAALLGTRSVAYDVDGLRDSVPAAGGFLTAESPAALARVAADYLSQPSSRSTLSPPAGAGVLSWREVADSVLEAMTKSASEPHRS